jgi:hypothetical protein
LGLDSAFSDAMICSFAMRFRVKAASALSRLSSDLSSAASTFIAPSI